MMRIFWSIAALVWCFGAAAASAQPTTEKILPMDGHITQDGRAIELNWFDATPPRVGPLTINRRPYGQQGAETWQTIASGLGPVMRYTDDTISPGIAYEYQVLRSARDIVDVGYWLGGTSLPAQAGRGHAYVIVDETLAEAIAPRLARFVRDLTGDGWQVQRHDVARSDDRKPAANLKNALAVKHWLRAGYDADPFGRHTVILVGHVPIVKSGRVAPDGHEAIPHATDLFYADMDGLWTALPDGTLLDSTVPGDFIEMQIGRIDFTPVSRGNRDTEIRLLRAYFDKNHHWRMGYHGDLRHAYGQNEHLTVEQAALRNIVGSHNVTPGGHHDAGEERPWLWGVDFGDWKGPNYPEIYANKAVFAINFGSNKQRIDGYFNPMTALLAQPWYPVAVGWGGRPAWWLHHMALGGSIGEVHMRTVNNGRAGQPYRETMDYFPVGKYLMRNGIWVNLLGDPTLHAFPLAPPGDVVATPMAEGTALSWQPSPDPDTQGYRVFRAPPGSDRFAPVSGPEPLVQTVFTDPSPVEGGRYMVRATGLKKVYAGSFHRLSQGAYATYSPVSETDSPGLADLRTTPGQSVALPGLFHEATQEGTIHALIEGPVQGELTQGAAGWHYAPPPGFAGTVTLRYSISGNRAPTTGRLTITVAAE